MKSTMICWSLPPAGSLKRSWTDRILGSSAPWEHSYISGYELTVQGRSIAWIQCSSGAGSLIIEIVTCAGLHFDKLLFIGAAGGLTAISAWENCAPGSGVLPVIRPMDISRKISQNLFCSRKVFPNDKASRLSAGSLSCWLSSVFFPGYPGIIETKHSLLAPFRFIQQIANITKPGEIPFYRISSGPLLF